MSLDAYTGTMGSGKSHEVTKEVILEHAKKGRGIVAIGMKLNIELISERCGFDAARVVKDGGSAGVAAFDADKVKESHFFPTEAEVVAGNTSHCVVQPGDLVVWDECWRDLGAGDKLSDEHMEFIRMHRHFAHPETRQTCDIVILIQDMASLNRKVKNVVESVWHLKKLRALGLNNAYLLSRYEGKSTKKDALVSTFRRKYDKTIFPLYQSHAGGAGKEGNIDRRTVFWKQPGFFIPIGLALALVIAAPFLVTSMLYDMAGGKPEDAETEVGADGNSSTQQAPTVQAPKIERPAYRVAGSIVDQRGDRWLLLDAGDGIRMVPEGTLQGNGIGYHGEYSGEVASTWGGAIPATVGNASGGAAGSP